MPAHGVFVIIRRQHPLRDRPMPEKPAPLPVILPQGFALLAQ